MQKKEKVYFIRKSKWILALVLLKSIFFLSFLVIILYWIAYFSSDIKQHNLTNIVILFLYILLFSIYLEIIISIARYYYDILIIDNKSIYRFKLWILFKEYIFIIDLYMIQEVDSHISGILNVLLNIWELNIIELKDRITTIHFLDDPQKIVHNIRESQYKYVDKKEHKTNTENRMKWWKV